jgi:hypothetical protein
VGTGTPLPLSPAELDNVRGSLQRAFPSLSDTFQVTSERTPEYNCIAWAAGDISRWWWPLGLSYWPENVLRAETMASFVTAFAELGYAPCGNGGLEFGIEKVVIFLEDGIPTHMARQLSSGEWTSKLGKSWDIVHVSSSELDGSAYGSAVQFLSRARK